MHKRRRSLLLCTALFVLLPLGGPACVSAQGLPALIEGRALDISDGDTFVLLDTLGKRWRVRLAGIDAPESSQPWADRSRLQLAEWLRDRTVMLVPIKTDPYGRLVARTRVASPEAPDEQTDVGLLLVEAGLAWHFKRYKADQSAAEYAAFASAEHRARQAGRGLWADPAPEPPWAYRERIRAARR